MDFCSCRRWLVQNPEYSFRNRRPSHGFRQVAALARGESREYLSKSRPSHGFGRVAELARGASTEFLHGRAVATMHLCVSNFKTLGLGRSVQPVPLAVLPV